MANNLNATQLPSGHSVTATVPVVFHAGVTSVNNKTGTVNLNATDVGADASGSAAAALIEAKDYTDDEAALRLAGDQAEQQARINAVSGEATLRAQADTAETNARIEAVAQEATLRNDAVNAASYASQLRDVDIMSKVGMITDLTTQDKTNVVAAVNEVNATKSSVSVSNTGTATEEVQYITVNGVEKKLAGGSGGTSDFEQLSHLPKYNDSTMNRNTNIPEVKTTTWDAKSTVSVSSTGTATDEVEYITIDGVEKKIATGTDLPQGTQPNQAVIFDGTNWTVQNGYGRYVPGSGQDLEWDGSYEGKEIAGDTSLFAFVKMSSTPVNDSDILNRDLTIGGYSGESYIELTLPLSTQATETQGVTSFANSTALDGCPFVLNVTQNATFELTIFTTPISCTVTPGIWFGKFNYTAPGHNEIAYAHALTIGEAGYYQKIDQNYTLPLPNNENPVELAKIDNNWIPVESTGFYVPGEQFSLTWDGDITGKQSAQGPEYMYYKISESLPSNSLAFIGGTMTISEEGIYTKTITESDFNYNYSGMIGIYSRNNNVGVYVCYDDNAQISTFSKGIWFAKDYGITVRGLAANEGPHFYGDQVMKIKDNEGHEFNSASGTVTISAANESYSGLMTAAQVIALGNKQNSTDNTLATTSKTVVGAINELNSGKSTVSVSSTGTATNEVQYITVDGTEKKIKGTTVSVSNTGTATDEVNYITVDGVQKKFKEDSALLNAKSTGGIGWTEGSGSTITWDGEYGTRPTYEFDTDIKIAKMSDDYSLTVEQVIGSTVTFNRFGTIYSFTVTAEDIGDMQEFFGVDGFYIYNEAYNFQPVWVFKETAIDPETEQEITPGTWFFKMIDLEREDPENAFTASFSYGSSTIHKIDSSYISRDPVLNNAITNQGIGWTEDYTPITWDGNFGTRPTFAFSEGVHLVKMSDDSSLTAEQLIGSTITFYRNEETQSFTVTSEHIENLVDFFGVEGLVITNEELEFQGVWIFKEEYVEEGQTVSTGLWFFKQVDLEREEPITQYTTGFSYGSSTIHKINSSYISSGASTTGQALTSDGSGGTSWTTVNNFNQFVNRPKYAGATMDSDTNIPQVPSKTSELTNDGDGTHAFLTEHQSLAAYRTSADQDVIDNTLQPKTDNLLSTTSKQVVGAINEIDAMIPAQASAENQLGDKNFINSSIATNTANYISNNGQPFNSVAELEAYSGTVTNNDYAFVTGTDSEGNTYFDRYKATVSGSTITWAKEYRLNNSSFTANQWASITSGITSSDVTKLGGIESGAEVNALEGVQLNGTDLTIDTNRKVNIPKAQGNSFGVIRVGNQTYMIFCDPNGYLYPEAVAYNIYPNKGNYIFISKGTLENVLDNESIRIDKTQSLSSAQKSQVYSNLGAVSSQGIPIATSISSSSTHNEVVSAKAVYDFVMSLMGQEVTNELT